MLFLKLDPSLCLQLEPSRGVSFRGCFCDSEWLCYILNQLEVLIISEHSCSAMCILSCPSMVCETRFLKIV